MEDRVVRWAAELQSMAQTGLYYCGDDFDRERYLRIREIAAEMAAERTGLPVEKVTGLFCGDVGYQTPKVDTRAAIFQDGKILLVQEKMAPGLCREDGASTICLLRRTRSRK